MGLKKLFKYFGCCLILGVIIYIFFLPGVMYMLWHLFVGLGIAFLLTFFLVIEDNLTPKRLAIFTCICILVSLAYSCYISIYYEETYYGKSWIMLVYAYANMIGIATFVGMHAKIMRESAGEKALLRFKNDFPNPNPNVKFYDDTRCNRIRLKNGFSGSIIGLASSGVYEILGDYGAYRKMTTHELCKQIRVTGYVEGIDGRVDNTAWDVILEISGGDEFLAFSIVKGMLKYSKAVLAEAQKAEVAIKEGATVEDIIAAYKEQKLQIERAKATVEYWKYISYQSYQNR